MGEKAFTPEIAKVGPDRRIRIPKLFCEKLDWLPGEGSLRVWLLTYVPGRLRLLADSEIEQNEHLHAIRSAILEGPTESVGAIIFESNERAALLGRLVPTTLAFHNSSWRLVLPEQIVSDPKEHENVVLLFSLGYLEIWFTDVYDAARTVPLDSLI